MSYIFEVKLKLTIDNIIENLKGTLEEKRFNHSIGVMEMAVKLAKIHGADENKAELAGLLHDCAKNIPYDDMYKMCADFRIELDEVTMKQPGLVHAFLGAYIAKRDYGIDDEIYDAIYYHTVGKPDMAILTKIIYIADSIEKNRHYEGVEELRELAYEDLDKALVMQIDNTIRSVLRKGTLLHTNTIDTRNYYLEKVQTEN